ncbi:MAG: oligosaccharide flippase family protein [bacterium]
MIDTLNTFLRKLDPHSQELFRGASVALILRVAGAALTFLLSLVLARTLGAQGAGIYFLAYGVVTIVSVGARLGLGGSLVRFTSAGATANEWSALNGLARRALTLGSLAAGVATVLLLFGAPWLAEEAFDEPQLTAPLRIMVLAILPFVLLNLLGQLLRGRKRIAQSLAVMAALPPAVTCVGVLVLAPTAGTQGAAAAYVIATVLTLALAGWWWHSASPRRTGPPGTFPLRTLLASSMPLFWHSLLSIVIDRSPGLFLGLFATASEVGILEVANRTALLVSFILLAVNSIAGPKFAELYSSGDIDALVRTARRSALLSAAAALPLVLVFVTVPEAVLSLFGERFTAGASILVILTLGQLFNAGTGSVAVLLVMSGNERAMRNVTLASLLVGVILYLGLIPLWGMHGAAVACALTVAFQNLMAVLAVRRALGIWALPYPSFPGRGPRGRERF